MSSDVPHEWKSLDPDRDNPGRKGMLLSDQINNFCGKGLLIATGYSQKRLRPAAYTLTIGDRYVDSSGNQHKLSDDSPSFEMKPNSIVFVSTAEELDLPYYIAARFNLRVEWVYKGILLGTGPQVEPGFRGNLSCPLYNLTDRPVTITRGQEFATIDFERTSDFVDRTPDYIAGHLQAHESGMLDVYQESERTLLLFKQKKFEALQKYPDHKIVSSLFQMQQELAMWRRIGIGIVVSFIALTMTLLGLHNNLLRETISNSKDIVQIKEQLNTVKGVTK